MRDQNIGVPIIVLSPDLNKILVGVRKNGYRPDFYGLPGGRVEVGEALEATAKRELAEETGLAAVTLDLLGFVKENQGEYDFIHFPFLCSKYQGELQNLEPHKCGGWEFISLERLPENLLPGHKAAIELWKSKKSFIEL